jgi:hypothetical protein
MTTLLGDDPVASVDVEETCKRRSSREINCLWMSRIGKGIVGLVHLVGAGEQAVSIALFRVDPRYRHTSILTNLIDRVRDYCCRCGSFTVRVESRVAPQWVLRQMDGRGMRLVRRDVVCGENLLEFRVEPGWHAALPAEVCPIR